MTESTAPLQDPVIVGKFGAPHGIRGALKLYTYTEIPEDVFNYTVRAPGRATPLRLTLKSAAADFFIVEVEGVSNREQAAALTNALLSVERAELPDIGDEEGTFYNHDLIGLRVLKDGEPAGIVAGMHNFGAGDIIEIKPHGNGDTYMLPFDDDHVPTVDMEARIVMIAEPDADDV